MSSTEPLIVELLTSNSSSNVIEANSVGTVPDSRFWLRRNSSISVIRPNSVGIVPVRSSNWNIKNAVICTKLPNSVGIVCGPNSGSSGTPVRSKICKFVNCPYSGAIVTRSSASLNPILNTRNAVHNDISPIGTVPVSMLLNKNKSFNTCRREKISRGIVPVNALLYNEIYSNDDIAKISVGIRPVKTLPCKSRFFKCRNNPNSGTISDCKELSSFFLFLFFNLIFVGTTKRY